MSSNLTLYETTVAVKAYNGGNWVTLQRGTGEGQYGMSIATVADGKTQITFTNIPDETRIEITYDALVKGDAKSSVEISNTVTISGAYETGVKKQVSLAVSDTGGTGGGSMYGFKLIKEDSQYPDIKLKGAKFALYAPTSLVGDVNAPDDAIQSFIYNDTIYYSFLQVTETSENGIATFDSEWLSSRILGKLLILKEISAPEGYVKSGGDIYVCLRDANFDEPPDPNFPANTVYLPSLANITPDHYSFFSFPNTPITVLLPETGGPGTARFTKTGLALMLASPVPLLLARRRRLLCDSDRR
jgi:hypothetical protein